MEFRFARPLPGDRRRHGKVCESIRCFDVRPPDKDKSADENENRAGPSRFTPVSYRTPVKPGSAKIELCNSLAGPVGTPRERMAAAFPAATAHRQLSRIASKIDGS